MVNKRRSFWLILTLGLFSTIFGGVKIAVADSEREICSTHYNRLEQLIYQGDQPPWELNLVDIVSLFDAEALDITLSRSESWSWGISCGRWCTKKFEQTLSFQVAHEEVPVSDGQCFQRWTPVTGGVVKVPSGRFQQLMTIMGAFDGIGQQAENFCGPDCIPKRVEVILVAPPDGDDNPDEIKFGFIIRCTDPVESEEENLWTVTANVVGKVTCLSRIKDVKDVSIAKFPKLSTVLR